MFTQLALINPEHVSEETVKSFAIRLAARAVLFDDNDDIGLLFVSKKGYYKLPGGGVEAGEDLPTALHRECMEEAGCAIAIDSELGSTVEYRAKFKIKQESFCYMAHVVGEKGKPAFEQDEINDGYQVQWHSLRKAIELVSKANSEEYQFAHIQSRELLFLEEAKRQLDAESNTLRS